MQNDVFNRARYIVVWPVMGTVSYGRAQRLSFCGALLHALKAQVPVSGLVRDERNVRSTAHPARNMCLCSGGVVSYAPGGTNWSALPPCRDDLFVLFIPLTTLVGFLFALQSFD